MRGVTLTYCCIVDYVLRSLIRVPKHFRNKRPERLLHQSATLSPIVVYLFAAYIILTILGINLTPLLASASVIGIIIGIGARSIIEDFVNGIFLLSLDSMQIGDYIKIGEQKDSSKSSVHERLTIRTQDGAIHIVPNSQIGELINFSKNKFNDFIDLPSESKSGY